MTDTVAEMLRPFVTAAFRTNAIRSVVLVDEEFDSLHELLANEETKSEDVDENLGTGELGVLEASSNEETKSDEANENQVTAELGARKALANAVARRLYDQMQSANLICDVINRPDQWDGEKIANADLIILDWHLSGGDDTSDAIAILRRLAQHSRFNLVVVYTNHPDLSQAARNLCGSLRHKTDPDANVEANFDQIAELADSMNPPVTKLVDAFLFGNEMPREFCREFKKACAKNFSLRGPQLEQVVRLLVESALRHDFGCSLGSEEIVPLNGDFEASQPWLVYENLFVCFASKAIAELQLLDALDQSLVAWNPGIPRTIVSETRNAIARKRHEFDDDFPHDLETQTGWLWYARKSTCSGTDGIRQLLKGVLTSFQNRVLSDAELLKFVEQILAVIPEKESEADQVAEAASWCGNLVNPTVNPQSVLHALNTFQSSASFFGEFITTGTILRRISGSHSEWLVAVEPACNLVPSQDRSNAAFLPCRMLELVKIRQEDIPVILGEAVHGRHLFVHVDQQRQYFSIVKRSQQPIIVDSFVPKDPQILQDAERLVVDIHFPNLRASPPVSTQSKYQIVAQLHEPYANRLLHLVGSHLSRIGLDFISYSEGQQNVGDAP